MRQLFAMVYTLARGQVKLTLARTMMRYVLVIQPLFFATLSYFMLRDLPGTGYGEYVVTGTGLMTLWMATLWSSATDVDRERWMGTLEVLLISPTSFPVIMLGKILGNIFLGWGALALTGVYSLGVLRVPLPVQHPWLALLALLALSLAFVGFALFLALLFTVSRRANVVANGLSFPMYLVSGVYFPLTLLPEWARGLGLAMPLAWGREALRWSVVGETASGQLLTSSFGTALMGLAIVGTVYFLGAYLLYRFVVHHKIRSRGQLGIA